MAGRKRDFENASLNSAILHKNQNALDRRKSNRPECRWQSRRYDTAILSILNLPALGNAVVVQIVDCS